jgi:hypothetical protein
MLSETMATTDLVAPSRRGQFCANLAAVLHTIAQPLTSLQLLFHKGISGKMKTEELRALVADSANEIERICTLFGYMQGFILTERSEPDLSEQDLGLMLAHVAEGLDIFFRDAGLHLRLDVTGVKKSVFVDEIKMYQALSRILLVVHELSIAKDTIELEGSCCSAHGALILIRNRDAYKALSKDATIRMTLAEMGIEHQGGRLTWTAEPFGAKIELPVARRDTGMPMVEPPLSQGAHSR